MKKSILKKELDVVISADTLKSLSPTASSIAVRYDVAEEQNHSSHSIIRDDGGQKGLIDENVTLRRKVDEKNKKIMNLCVLLEAMEPLPDMNPEKLKRIIDGDVDGNVDYRDSKIVSLAKKSHNLTMLLNKERCDHEDLKQRFAVLKSSFDAMKQQALTAPSRTVLEPRGYGRNTAEGAGNGLTAGDDSVVDTVAALMKDARDSMRLIDDLKRRLQQQTDENKALLKALSRELGDAATVEQAVDGGWRGRAQQIIMLKAKVWPSIVVSHSFM